MTSQKKDKVIIDMRQASQHELYVLSCLLMTINSSLNCHGFKIHIRKTKTPAHPTPTVAQTR